MKRFGEKALREALENGAIIREWDWYMNKGYRVIIKGQEAGYIVSDLFSKLWQDFDIVKTWTAYSYRDYKASAEMMEDAAKRNPCGMAACILSVESERDTLGWSAETIWARLKESEANNGVMFNRRMWSAFSVVFPDFQEPEQEQEEQQQEEAQEAQEQKEEENMKKHVYLIRYTEKGINCWDNVEAASEAEAVETLRDIDPETPVSVYNVATYDSFEEAIEAAYSEADLKAVSEAVQAATANAIAKAFPEQQEQQEPELIPVDSLREGLELGDYGEYVNDYRGSSAYICDMIVEIADSKTSIYYSDIMHFISRNPEALADVIDEGLYDPSRGYDLHQHGQAAEYMTIERDLWDHLEHALLLAAVDFIRYDMERETIPAELAELLQEWAADPGDRMDEIPDRIQAYFAAAEEAEAE